MKTQNGSVGTQPATSSIMIPQTSRGRTPGIFCVPRSTERFWSRPRWPSTDPMKILYALEEAIVVAWAIVLMCLVPAARALRRKERFNDSRTRRF